VISPPSQFLTDIGAGQLANVTWITPTYSNSDHPGLNSAAGPAWVASLVNAVGTSKFWNSTAIFVMWDDWGGWFDPVKPVFRDYDGLGFRVPILMVSAYAKRGTSRTSSMRRERPSVHGGYVWPRAACGRRCTRKGSGNRCVRLQPKARRFKKIPGAKPSAYWMLQERRSPGTRSRRASSGDD